VNRAVRAGTLAAVGAGWAAHAVPSVASIAPLRRAATPRLYGVPARDHVALTFDDGPAPESTPLFLDALRSADVRATFFVLGSCLREHPDLGRRILAEGHELGVHGWVHRPHLLRSPRAVLSDMNRTVRLIEQVTGVRPRYWRPPHGITTGSGLWAARRLGLTPVLWTADGRDWRASATAATVRERLGSHLDGGAVVLLHDADTTSAPQSWRSALAALPWLVDTCRGRGLRVGPLGEHLQVQREHPQSGRDR
jgi:peptidoglycan/xylan/chitin deacetylase (PgdA/CDA1 family)